MPNDGRSPRLAILIDADNTSADYARAIFDEIAKLGEANVRRIYGDFWPLFPMTSCGFPWPSEFSYEVIRIDG